MPNKLQLDIPVLMLKVAPGCFKRVPARVTLLLASPPALWKKPWVCHLKTLAPMQGSPANAADANPAFSGEISNSVEAVSSSEPVFDKQTACGYLRYSLIFLTQLFPGGRFPGAP